MNIGYWLLMCNLLFLSGAVLYVGLCTMIRVSIAEQPAFKAYHDEIMRKTKKMIMNKKFAKRRDVQVLDDRLSTVDTRVVEIENQLQD